MLRALLAVEEVSIVVLFGKTRNGVSQPPRSCVHHKSGNTMKQLDSFCCSGKCCYPFVV